MSPLRVILSAMLIASLTGCASYQVTTKNSRSVPLDSNRPVYIALTQGEYPQENQETQNTFVQEWRSYSKQVIPLKTPSSLREAIKKAQLLGEGYLVYPLVKQWEDHNTPWSTIRDKVQISVVLIDIKSGRILDKSVLNGKSTTWTMKNTTPSIILPNLVNRYIEPLYK